ncbi:MAG: ribonuclease HII [Candidatus Micrarchaeota archaeon]
MSLIAGIDEAGRGCVIGPLVIVMFSCQSENEPKINALCKKDSKQLSQKQREIIFEQIKHLGKINFIELSAVMLNQLMKKETLNEIEAMFIAKLVKNLNVDVSVKIDLPDRYSWVFAKRMERYGIKKYEAEHKADENHPIVAAASIIAKVLRDRKIEEIKNEVGDFGSGYPCDEKTITFLRNKENMKNMAKYIRKKWKTLETIKQTKLFIRVLGFGV